jgi:peptidylprolyl isomerase
MGSHRLRAPFSIGAGVCLWTQIAAGAPPPDDAKPKGPLSAAELLAKSQDSDWRRPDPEQTLYLELLRGGRVVIELAPKFAPRHVANVKALTRERYFDGLAIVRAQDNYVVQWGDPEADSPKAKPMRTAKRSLQAELDRAIAPDLPFTPLGDRDVYAPEVGFSLGLPAARDGKTQRSWLAHCYGMVGAGRGDTADSGNGAELYVVIGHSPRHLDRNVTLLGRVLSGIELLSTLPRGTGELGFYEKPSERVAIKSVRVAADVPEAERTPLEVLRTDTPLFRQWVEARRNRREPWFLDPVGHIELCNAPVPVRTAGPLSKKPAK